MVVQHFFKAAGKKKRKTQQVIPSNVKAKLLWFVAVVMEVVVSCCGLAVVMALFTCWLLLWISCGCCYYFIVGLVVLVERVVFDLGEDGADQGTVAHVIQ